MISELTVLALTALLQAVQFVLYEIRANREIGSGDTSSARHRSWNIPAARGRFITPDAA